MPSKHLRAVSPRTPIAVALTLMLVVIWLLTHRYQGLAQDARIYAMQAFARIHFQLQGDLYLQNTSQDRYTVFSPFYAAVIRLLGLPAAARTLMVLFAGWFLVAAWSLAKDLVGAKQAWLATGALILTVGAYGSYGVFHFSEDYLTARTVAEALAMSAFALHARGLTPLGLLTAVLAFLVHPLMALPGILLLIFWMVSTRTAVLMAVAGITLAGTIAALAALSPRLGSFVPRLDEVWLHIVKERSQFLFLQLWVLRDWETNVRPFVTLGLAAAVLVEDRVRKLCFAATVVGACGLIIAFVAGTLGNVAILLQGQAWRWVWIPACIAALLLIPTAMRLWRTQTTGPLCALLLLASWTLSIRDAPSLAVLAFVLFGFRSLFSDATGKSFKLTAVILGITLCVWQLTEVVGTEPSFASSSAAVNGEIYRRFPLTILLWGTWRLLTTSKSRWLPAALSVALGVACVLLVPIAFGQFDAAGSELEVAEFADWENAIPPTSNVFVADGHDAAPFAWFTLRRPSYLSLDQSAGVIFSRPTAVEVARRARVLVPLMDEDWKLYSRNRTAHRTGIVSPPRRTVLTAAGLSSVCGDPQLGFVIAREDVGFAPLQHLKPGPWMHWNLYDCARVRSLEPNN